MRLNQCTIDEQNTNEIWTKILKYLLETIHEKSGMNDKENVKAIETI